MAAISNNNESNSQSNNFNTPVFSIAMFSAEHGQATPQQVTGHDNQTYYSLQFADGSEALLAKSLQDNIRQAVANNQQATLDSKRLCVAGYLNDNGSQAYSAFYSTKQDTTAFKLG